MQTSLLPAAASCGHLETGMEENKAEGSCFMKTLAGRDLELEGQAVARK